MYDHDPSALRNEAHRLRNKATELDRQAKLIEVSRALDDLHVPLDASHRATSTALRAAGFRFDKNVVSQIVQERKKRLTCENGLS